MNIFENIARAVTGRLHAGDASMRVRLASLVPIVSANGTELTRAGTVTLLNDWCLLAPAALPDPAIEWEALDDRSAHARYTVGANTIAAVLCRRKRPDAASR